MNHQRRGTFRVTRPSRVDGDNTGAKLDAPTDDALQWNVTLPSTAFVHNSAGPAAGRSVGLVREAYEAGIRCGGSPDIAAVPGLAWLRPGADSCCIDETRQYGEDLGVMKGASCGDYVPSSNAPARR